MLSLSTVGRSWGDRGAVQVDRCSEQRAKICYVFSMQMHHSAASHLTVQDLRLSPSQTGAGVRAVPTCLPSGSWLRCTRHCVPARHCSACQVVPGSGLVPRTCRQWAATPDEVPDQHHAQNMC